MVISWLRRNSFLKIREHFRIHSVRALFFTIFHKLKYFLFETCSGRFSHLQGGWFFLPLHIYNPGLYLPFRLDLLCSCVYYAGPFATSLGHYGTCRISPFGASKKGIFSMHRYRSSSFNIFRFYFNSAADFGIYFSRFLEHLRSYNNLYEQERYQEFYILSVGRIEL